jgi:hypothetical protein
MSDFDNNPWGDPEFEQRVREMAYFLWTHAGRPSGQEKPFWYEALERSLREREADGLLEQEPRDIGKTGQQ